MEGGGATGTPWLRRSRLEGPRPDCRGGATSWSGAPGVGGEGDHSGCAQGLMARCSTGVGGCQQVARRRRGSRASRSC